MTPEELLKEYIISKYKNLNSFSKQVDIPYSTIKHIFIRGISGSGVSLIVKICKHLNIDTESLIDGEVKERQIDNLSAGEKDLVRAYRANPDMQRAVNKLLGIPSESKNDIGERENYSQTNTGQI